ncbi:MAG: lipopolysaccharide biosynthesis protein [Nevskiales bacterium]|nr:lipopolysaccharide biosynthesis protein [Nevskiales bacterium]
MLTVLRQWVGTRRRVLGEGAWVVLGNFGAALGALAGTRLLTEFLPTRVFGETMLLLGIATLGYGLSGAPFVQAAIRSYPDHARTGSLPQLRAGVAALLVRSGPGFGGLWVLGWLVYAVSTEARVWSGLLLVPLLALDMARSLEVSLFNAARRQKPMALWSVTEAWGRPVFAVLATVLIGTSATSVLSGYVVASAVILTFFCLTTRREGVDDRPSGTGHADAGVREELWRYALPLLPLGLISWSSALADRYMIGGLLGVEQAGLYAAAYGIASRPAMALCGAVEATLRPLYFQAVSSGDAPRTRRIFFAWLGGVTVTAAGLFMLFLLFSDLVAQVCLGERYRSGASLMPWIAAGYSLSAISHVFAGVSYARRNTSNVLMAQLAGAVAALVLGLAGIYFLGVKGAAAAVVAAFGLQLAVAMALARRPARQ